MKTAYLTLDDSPSEHLTQKVDILLRLGIPAIFFCQGDHLEQRPDQALYALRHGFILGNHAYDHPSFSDLPLAECYEQIRRTDALLNRLYEAAGLQWTAKYFRFPYGDKGGLQYNEVFAAYHGEGAERKRRIQEYLRQLGYCQPSFDGITYKYYRDAGLLADVDWHWTYDVMDWSIYHKEPAYGVNSLEKVLERMEENVPEGCRGLNCEDSDEIILTHDHANTGTFFETIMKRLCSKRLVFKLP